MNADNQEAADRAVERVRAGDIDAYAEVVRLYEHPLRAMLAGLCPPGLSSDEVAQTVFVEAYRRLEDYRPGTSMLAWLKTIARYALLAEYKRRQREAAHHDAYLQHMLIGGLNRILQRDREPDDARVEALRACVGLLDPRARDVLIARYDARTPLQTTAEKLGRTVAAIKVQLFAIRRKLRACVQQKLAATTG